MPSQATIGLVILGFATLAYLWAHMPEPQRPLTIPEMPRRGDKPDTTIKVGGRPGLPLESFGNNMSNLLETSVWF